MLFSHWPTNARTRSWLIIFETLIGSMIYAFFFLLEWVRGSKETMAWWPNVSSVRLKERNKHTVDNGLRNNHPTEHQIFVLDVIGVGFLLYSSLISFVYMHWFLLLLLFHYIFRQCPKPRQCLRKTSLGKRPLQTLLANWAYTDVCSPQNSCSCDVDLAAKWTTRIRPPCHCDPRDFWSLSTWYFVYRDMKTEESRNRGLPSLQATLVAAFQLAWDLGWHERQNHHLFSLQ